MNRRTLGSHRAAETAFILIAADQKLINIKPRTAGTYVLTVLGFFICFSADFFV